MRDGFIFYSSFYEALSGLNDEQKGQCITVISKYALYGEEPQLDNPIVKMFYVLAKPQIDANNQKYENGKKGAEYGKLGGRPKKNPNNENETPNIENENPEKTPEKPLENPNETPKVKEKDKVKDKEKEKYILTNIQKEKKKKTFSAEFEEWWKYCPKKVAKDLAFRKFNTLLLGNIVTLDELIDGMKRYSDKCFKDNTEDKYIKYPATWLNQGCWKDEYTTWKTIDAKPDAFEIFNQAMDEIERRAAQ